jgi:arylsulfatase A-like enzyme
VQPGLRSHLDVAATVCDLLGAPVPDDWDGRSVAAHLRAGTAAPGREHVVVTQGAWACQRGVRSGAHLYLRTSHDGYHPHWPDEMLFDVVTDPHERFDVLEREPRRAAQLRSVLDDWISDQLDRSYASEDPLLTVLAGGGPSHVRGHLEPYLDRLVATGRGEWADVLVARHGPAGAHELEPAHRSC